METIKKKKIILKDLFLVLLLLFFSFWSIFPFLAPGLPNTHDGLTHVMRLASFHQALLDGQFPPRWAGNLAFGFGSPVISLGFQLPYFIGDAFHLIGFSFQDSIKGVFILGYLLSGLSMYLFLRKFGAISAFTGSVLYLFAPYRFLDLYVRGDVGESFVFIFPPLVLLLLWNNSKKMNWQKISLAAFFIGLMFLSHQITAFVFSSIILILLSFRRNFKEATFSIFGGLLLSSYNILPLVVERSSTNLAQLMGNNYLNQFPKIGSILYSKWNWGPAQPNDPSISMSFQLGFAQWLAVISLIIILIFNLIKNRKKLFSNPFPLAIGGLSIAFLFLITDYSKFLWDRLFFLQGVLYPWRLLAIETFLASVMGALAIHFLKRKEFKVFLAALFIILAFYANRNHNQVVGRTMHLDNFYINFPGTSDMWGEFLPKGAQAPKGRVENKIEADTNIKIDNLKIKSNEILFNTQSQENGMIRVNNFYYPGWEVFVDNQKTTIAKSQTFTFSVPKGNHLIRVLFSETLVRRFADCLSLLTAISLFVIFMVKFLKR
ncbi:MAG: glycosyltransferase family 39 protein [bacterium]|nr:glycosyltransferase family 39 protein [bacterium]